ncbi:unnamed protein product [Clonostachys solani]|uniref:Uncharacterized protein n=1 Tax=Clonostachys solani TaxID=160281 RepID=A0A9N9ZC39_9HYPO|nr:unnamed protein product [Clonostachys solani]
MAPRLRFYAVVAIAQFAIVLAWFDHSMAPVPDHMLHVRSHDGLTSAEIGAMVGAIIGFTVIVLFTIFCCINRSRVRRHRRRSDDDEIIRVEKLPRHPNPPLQHPLMAKVRWSQRDFNNVEGGLIPGGPKYPTYRALPIPNPRNNPKVTRDYRNARTYRYY